MLFGKGAPRIPDSQWRADRNGVVSNGDCGGDIQCGESYSVRYVRPDMPGSLITVAFYAVEYDENPGEFGVQRQVEFMVCADPADPGGTEIWSEEARDDVNDLVIDTAEDAEREAREFALMALELGYQHTWNGLAPWDGGN